MRPTATLSRCFLNDPSRMWIAIRKKLGALGVIRSNSFTVNKILMFQCLDCLKNRSKIPRGSKILCKSHPRMHSVINYKAKH